jgi:hypothetical protein
MNKWISMWMLAALATVARAELLTNPGFESGDFSGWETFGPGWRTSTGGDAHTGDYGAVNDVTDWQAPEEQWRGVFQNVSVIPGESYELSAFIRAVNIAHSESWLEVKWKNADGVEIEGTQAQSPHVVADQPFTQVTLSSLMAPAGAVSASVNAIVFMIDLPASGEDDFHLFDDFSFTRLPANPVQDRSFESGTLDAWMTFGVAWRLGVGGDAHSGLYGIVNDVMNVQGGEEWRGIYQILPVTPGQTYEASAYIRTFQVAHSASWIEVQWLDAASNFISQVQSAYVTADQPFTLVELSPLSPPANAAYASLRGVVQMFALPGAETEFHIFDDFSFLPMDTPVSIPLDIAFSTESGIVISWEDTGEALALESSPVLIDPEWTPVADVPVVVAGRRVVTLSSGIPTAFFQLTRP